MARPRLRAVKRLRAIFPVLLLPVLAAAGTIPGATRAATRASSGSSGLVAAYSFDAGSGSTAPDASGNGNTGTLTNASWTSAGQYGGALSFDGKSSYVTVADNASLDLSSALTLEAWVYPTASPNGSGAIVAKERAGGGFPYGFEMTGGVPDAYVNAGSTTVTSAASALPKNSWTFVSASYDGALLRLYVNGAQVSSVPAVGSLVNSADPLRIGADLTWGEYFQGRIDNVRVYNRALAAAEIQTDMATAIGGSPAPPDTQPPSVPAGLATGSVGQTDIVLNWSPSSDNVGVAGYGVYLNGTSVGSPSSTTFDFSGLTCGTSYTLAVDAYDAAGNRSAKASLTAVTSPCPSPSALVAAYSFDAGSGSTAADDSGKGNAGTLANASWTSAGKYGGALSFNGSSSYVTVADNASLDLSGALTLEAWVYPTTSAAGSGAIVAKERAGGGLPYGFETTGGVPDAYINVGSHASVSGTAALPLNSWTFVSASYDGTLLRLYVNGAQVSSVPAVGSVVASADPLRIGADLTWGEYFQGRIDNVRVYSRALAAAEIQTDMATAIGGSPAPPDTQPPSVPAGLANTGATPTSVSLSWSASSDNVGVAGYGVYKNSVQAQTSSTTSATVSGLSCGTSYTFAVDAYDAAGNHSAQSASLSASTSACSDTQAPTVPTNLQTTSTSQTSVSISWTASTDNVGVSGYGLYQNNTNVGSTSGTMYSFNGLACGTSYALAVDAYDAAGNRSTKAAITASTSACSVGAAVYVSPTGSDSNGCTQFSPCLSFDRAYHVAAPGQVVQAAGGTYPEQTLLYDASKEGATQHVVIQPAPGASVTINGNINISNTRGVKGASHLTIQNMTVLQDVDVEGCGVPDGTQCPADLTSGSNDLTFQNLRVKGPYAWVCHSCSNIQILGGIWGPDTYLPCHNSDHPEVSPQYDSILGGKLKRPNHILLDGTRWQNFSRCSSADHTECLQFEPADYVTIRNSVFTHCDTITLAFFDSLAYNSTSDAGLSVPDHIVIENNFIDQSYDATGGGTYNALQIPECTNCVIRYNSWLQNAYLPTTRSFNDQVIGNVGPQVPWSCGGSGVTFSHNVFEGATCGPTDKNVADILFVNRNTLDLHLKLGSPAINAGDPSNYPATDFDGQARPLGGAPDAGADEAG